MDVSKLGVSITADGTQAVRTLDQLRGSVGQVSNSMGSMTAAVFKGVAAWDLLKQSTRFVVDQFVQTVNELARLNDAALQAGTTTEKLSGLLREVKISGGGLDDLTAITTKLVQALVQSENAASRQAKAFRDLGVQTKESNGAYRDTADILVDVARALDGYRDGANKGAIAQALLSEEGARYLPLLQDIARSSNLTALATDEASQKAEEFQRQMRELAIAGEELKFMLAEEVLPAITSIIRTYLDASRAGEDFLGSIRAVIENTFIDWEATLATAERQYAEFQANLARADAGQLTLFERMMGSEDDWRKGLARAEREIQQARQKLAALDFAQDPFDSTGIGRSGGRSAPAPGSSSAASEAAAAQRRLNAAWAEAVGVTADYAQKVSDLEQLLGAGRITTDQYVEAIKRLAEAQPAVQREEKALAEAQRARAEILKVLEEESRKQLELEREIRDIDQRKIDALATETEQLREQVVQQMRSNEEIGLTATQLLELEDRRLAHAIAMKQETIANYELQGGRADEIVQLRQQIELIERLRRERAQGGEAQAMVDAQQAALESAAQWRESMDSIGDTLTDALMRGFEAGKGMAENFRETVRNMFKTLVLRPVVQGIVGAGLSSAAGIANAAIGGSSALGSIGTVGALSGIAGYAATGFMNSIVGTGVGAGLSAAGSLASAGSFGSAAGMAIGSVAPYILAAAAITRLLGLWGTKPKEKGNFGVAGFSGGGFTGFGLSDPIFGAPKGSYTADEGLQALAQATGMSAIQLSRMFGGTGQGDFSIATRLTTTGNGFLRPGAALVTHGGGGYSFSMGDNLPKDPAEAQALLAGELNKVIVSALGMSDINEAFREYFAQFSNEDLRAMTGEQAAAILQTAEAARVVTVTMVQLSETFEQYSGVAIEARAAFADLFGGVEQFTAGIAAYVQAVYSEEERLDLATRQVTTALSQLGVNALPATAEAYRALVEAQDLNTESGRETAAALIQLAPAWREVIDAMNATEEAIGGVVNAAEQFEVRIRILQEEAGLITERIAALEAEFGSLTPAVVTVADELASTTDQIDALSSALSDALGGAAQTAMQQLQELIGFRDQMIGARSNIQSMVFEASLGGMTGSQQVTALRGLETELWAQLTEAVNKAPIAEQLAQVTIRRIGLETEMALAQAQQVAEVTDTAGAARLEQIDAEIDALREMQRVAERMRSVAEDIGRFLDTLAFSDLSILNPADQLAAARSAFESTATRARAGDVEAMQSVIAAAQGYLGEGQGFFGSTSGYVQIYGAVTQTLRSLGLTLGGANPDAIGGQIDALTAEREQLRESMRQVATATSEEIPAAVILGAQQTVDALNMISGELNDGIQFAEIEIQSLTQVVQSQIDELTQIRENLEARLTQAAAEHAELVGQLNRTNELLEQTLDEQRVAELTP